jgi:WASH complex subunit strumpellin
MNNAVLNDVKAHYSRPETKAYPANPILPNISKYLDVAGINNPITKIYMTTEPVEGLPGMILTISCNLVSSLSLLTYWCIRIVLMFLFVLAQMNKLQFDSTLSTLTCKDKKTPLDGAPFVVGVATILKQFHSTHTHSFLSFLGQYIRANISFSTPIKGVGAIPPDVTNVLLFLEEFCRYVTQLTSH